MLFSVVQRPSDGATVVLHILSLNISFMRNLSPLTLTPLKFIKYILQF